MISAEVICDSISLAGKRIITFKLRYPKFIHGEFMTHRLLTRNASSSRAIPTAKLIEEVRTDHLRAAPEFWGENQAGMQAAKELDDVVTGSKFWGSNGQQFTAKKKAQDLWRDAAMHACVKAQQLLDIGAHKQIVNRILEPFSHINVVATATEWENFFGLRLHHMAQPEMRILAEEMWMARLASVPQQMAEDEWHLPFIGPMDWTGLHVEWPYKEEPFSYEALRDKIIKVSVARCARVSYESFFPGNKRSTITEDLELYTKLNLPGTPIHNPLEPIHCSPAEHQAVPDVSNEARFWTGTDQYAVMQAHADRVWNWNYPQEHGNFVGWRQYRKMLAGESCAPLPKEFQS